MSADLQPIFTSPAGAEAVARRYREVLAAWPVPAAELRVPTRAGETFVLVSGPADAPPVVLLHGSAANAAAWLDDVAVWAQQFRLYAVDVIGHPGFSAPARPPYAGDAHSAWLAEVMDGLGIARAAFVGTSLGGWLAVDHALRRPERVEALVLIVPGGIGRERMSMARILLTVLPLRLFGAPGRRASMRRLLGPPPTRDSAAVRTIGELFELVNRHFRHRFDPLPRFGDDDLARLTQPTLLVVGLEDPMLDSAESIARLTRLARDVETIALPDAGHVLFGQTRAIADFLERRLGGRAGRGVT